MPPVSFAGPPSMLGAVPGRVIPVPLIPPPCDASAGDAERTKVVGPAVGPIFAAPTGAAGNDPTVPGRTAVALNFTPPVAPVPGTVPAPVAGAPMRAGGVVAPMAFFGVNAGAGAGR